MKRNLHRAQDRQVSSPLHFLFGTFPCMCVRVVWLWRGLPKAKIPRRVWSEKGWLYEFNIKIYKAFSRSDKWGVCMGGKLTKCPNDGLGCRLVFFRRGALRRLYWAKIDVKKDNTYQWLESLLLLPLPFWHIEWLGGWLPVVVTHHGRCCVRCHGRWGGRSNSCS